MAVWGTIGPVWTGECPARAPIDWDKPSDDPPSPPSIPPGGKLDRGRNELFKAMCVFVCVSVVCVFVCIVVDEPILIIHIGRRCAEH